MQQFLGDIPVLENQNVDDIFAKPVIETTEVPTKDEEVHKNRQHRRLESRLQEEREANIALNARLQALSEAQKFATDIEGSIDESLLRLYGDNDTGRQAAKITQNLLNRTRDEATHAALEKFQETQQQEANEIAEQHGVLDGMLEELEDEFNVDLTSNTAEAKRARIGFFATLERVSPKDKEGNVKDYADPIATWEFYQSQNKPDNNRAKDLGSRSMVKSGASGTENLQITAQERFLKEAGII